MKNNVRVGIIETGEVFDSITACANYIGGNARHASIVSRNPRMTCKGYHIVRIDEPIPEIDLSKSFVGRPGIRVRIVETGDEFDSIKECAEFMNCSSGRIHDALTGYNNIHTYNGYHLHMCDLYLWALV